MAGCYGTLLCLQTLAPPNLPFPPPAIFYSIAIIIQATIMETLYSIDAPSDT